VAFTSVAQQKAYTTKSKKAIAYYEASEDFYIRRQYGQAVELLQKALDKDEEFAEAHLRMMRIYGTVGDKAKIRYHAGKIIAQQNDNPKFAEAYYMLANLAFEAGDYEKADQYLSEMLKMNANPRVKKEGERMQVNISFAKEAIKNPLPFNPQPLPTTINKLPLQYFPVLTADQQSIIFTGRRGITPQYDEDVYISTKNAQGAWQEPKLISPNITSEFNEGTCTISADGRTLIFTSCTGRRVLGSCDLFISYKEGEEWSKPENMGTNINSRAWESQPSLSADGKTLFYVSDRPGGLGMMDIYVSYLGEDGQWEKPKNLRSINTAQDEVSPFIHVNGQTLYFASTGYPGFGGLDLYQAEKKGDTFTTPENLGYPLNTHGDQVSLFMTADGAKGYYSLEKGREGIDYTSTLMEFDVPASIRVKNRSNFVKGIIRDAETKEVLSAEVELFDLNEQKREYTVQSDAVTGEYMMVLTEGAEYALYVEKEGYLFESLTFNYTDDLPPAQKLEPVYIDIYLKPIKAGKETVLNNIFFDTDQYVLKPKSKTELNKVVRFLQNNPDINIRINGHTDDVGTEEYNQQLSLNRAKAVYEYLVETGISVDRLDYKGFGEAKPIVANDSEINRQRNRRIAFEVVQ